VQYEGAQGGAYRGNPQTIIVNQLTPTNAPNQVLSLISLLKDYPNTHFGTDPLPSTAFWGNLLIKKTMTKLDLVHLLV
jgi:hypothetical protein